MRKLQSLIALFGVIAITGVFSSPSAKATVLTSDVHALKAEQTSFVDKAYYRRYYHRRYYRRGFYHRRYYGGSIAWLLRLRLSSPPLLVAQWLSPLPSVVLKLQPSITNQKRRASTRRFLMATAHGDYQLGVVSNTFSPALNGDLC